MIILCQEPHEEQGEKSVPVSQMLLCVAIVFNVSPSCERTAPQMVNSFTDNLQARAFAIAVMDAVSSHGLINIISLYYNICYIPERGCILKKFDFY